MRDFFRAKIASTPQRKDAFAQANATAIVMTNFLSGNTPEKWEEIKTHPFYKFYLEKLVNQGEEYISSPVPALPYTAYCRFCEDGNRTAYEIPSAARRERLRVLTVLTKLYGEKYLGALCDVIWAILDECTWALPAHIKEGFDDPYTRRTFLELGSTTTGAILTECEAVLGEVIPLRIRKRMKTEIRERIIAPYFHNIYWWMEGTNNWGAVCCANVMSCIAHYGTPEEFYRAEPSMNATVLNFIASYGKDGCCAEGVSYWYYGFGHFVRYADVVRNYTKIHPSVPVAHIFATTPVRACETVVGREFVKDGVIDYFAREDVRRAALFAANMRLCGECSVSFSDGPREYYFEPYLLAYLKKEYPDDIFYPAKELERFSLTLHNFIWADPDGTYGEKRKEGAVYYAESQWFIDNRKKYSLAAKGGHNYESHNHNDIGSFLIATEKGMCFADLGSGEYTRQYFDNAYRYDILVCSSRGHSVPIVNGKYQCRPQNIVATAETDGKAFFEVEYAAFYEDLTLKTAKRSFACDDNGVTLTDVFSFTETPKSLVERFVSLMKPELGDGAVTLGNVKLSYDKTAFTAHVSTEDYNGALGKKQTAYLIDLFPVALAKDAAYTFRFSVE